MEPKTVSVRPQNSDSPRSWSVLAAKTPQDPPRTAPRPPQDRSKTPEDHPRLAPELPRRPQDAPNTCPRRAQDLTKTPQDPTRPPKDGPRPPKRRPRRPRAPQESPGGAKRRPKERFSGNRGGFLSSPPLQGGPNPWGALSVPPGLAWPSGKAFKT